MIESRPAGFSKFWLQKILRKEMKFDGLIISDDLSMKAAKVYGEICDRLQLSFEAGCDSVLLCNDRRSLINVLDEYTNTFNKLKTKINLKNLQLLKPLF